MRFMSGKALKQLLEKGTVATMRNYPYRLGQVVTINNRFRAVIKEVYDNTPENRQKLFHISGFGSVEEWEKTAVKYHNGRLPKYIFIIRLLGGRKKWGKKPNSG